MGTGDGHGYPKAIRLRRRPEFLRVQRGGRRVRGRHLVVLHKPGREPHTRFGLVVSKKVGNAVVRNRVKRWLREAVRRADRSRPLDVVIIARSSAATAGLEALRAEVTSALERLAREESS